MGWIVLYRNSRKSNKLLKLKLKLVTINMAQDGHCQYVFNEGKELASFFPLGALKKTPEAGTQHIRLAGLATRFAHASF